MLILEYANNYISDKDVRSDIANELISLVKLDFENMKSQSYLLRDRKNIDTFNSLPIYEKQKFIYNLCDFYLVELTGDSVAPSSTVYDRNRDSSSISNYLINRLGNRIPESVSNTLKLSGFKGIILTILTFILSIDLVAGTSLTTSALGSVSSMPYITVTLVFIYLANKLLRREGITNPGAVGFISRTIYSIIDFVKKIFSFYYASRQYSAQLVISINYQQCAKLCNIDDQIRYKLFDYFKRQTYFINRESSTSDYANYYLSNIEKKQIECFENCSINHLLDLYADMYASVEKCKRGLAVSGNNNIDAKVLTNISQESDCYRLQVRLNELENDIKSVMSYVYPDDRDKLRDFQNALDSKKSKTLQSFSSISREGSNISRFPV